MRINSVVVLVIAAAAAGWIAPGLPVRTADQHAPEAASTNRDQATENAGWMAGETVLDREADGHFYAHAAVESRDARFLVDTGASVVALTGDDARAIGLAWDESDLVPIGRGANGTVYGVPVRLAEIRLGGFEERDVEAAIIPEGLDVSLLGQSFLSRLPGVRIEGDRMVLGNES
jgi:aspartyl protease family protein